MALPTADTFLHELGLADVARSIRAGAVGPVELAQHLLQRAEALGHSLNVFLHLDPEQILRDAGRAESRLSSTTADDLPPLLGVPIALKDLFDIRGTVTTAGSPLSPAEPAAADSAVAERLKAAGAVLFGKTHTHEWALGATSVNPHYGPARNPWDTDRIPGGSSGGNAVGLAARMFPGAVGSDTGGSIRIPAALCGVTGLKPTRGRVSLRGVVPLSWSLDHAGPMTRSAEDAALLLAAITGYDPADPASRHMAPSGRGEPIGPTGGDPAALRGLRVGVPADYFWEAADPGVVAAVKNAIADLKAGGCLVCELSGLDWQRAVQANGTILLTDAAAYHLERLRGNAGGYGDDVLKRLRAGQEKSGVEVALARREQQRWRRQLAATFEEVDLIATPVTPSVASPIAGLNGVGAAISLTSLTSPFNLAGVPAAAVPCGFVSGLPVGLQLAGRWWADSQVLAAAAAYQQLTDWHRRAPPVDGVTGPGGAPPGPRQAP